MNGQSTFSIARSRTDRCVARVAASGRARGDRARRQRRPRHRAPPGTLMEGVRFDVTNYVQLEGLLNAQKADSAALAYESICSFVDD